MIAVAILKPRLVLRRIPTLAGAALAAVLLFSPLVLPYLRSAEVHGFQHELPEGVDLSHYVSTTPTNLFYGSVGAPVRLQQKAPHFIGFISMALVLVAVTAWALRYQEGDS